jgi:hypothetical protein
MQVTADFKKRINATMSTLKNTRESHWDHWRDLADFYIPRRYRSLLTNQEQQNLSKTGGRNPRILDAAGTRAAKVLAAGMMNGITSPSRPWFKLRVPDADPNDIEIATWTEKVQELMLTTMAESNFYNALAVMYLDLAVFGSAATLIYEDEESVIRCYNPMLGDFYFSNSARLAVDTFARKLKMNGRQIRARFPDGKDAWPTQMTNTPENMERELRETHIVCHLIEPITKKIPGVPSSRKFVEYYWIEKDSKHNILERKSYDELPGMFPRWDVSGEDAYGVSPAMEAIGDVIQLQQETLSKAKGLDMMIQPPMNAGIELQTSKIAMVPNGVTFVSDVRTSGLSPVHRVQLPLGELTQDIMQVKESIREAFHNELFNMISQLDTVRSATEIDARKEEKLVLLGPVLERFENEALDPAINRVFGIMNRRGMLPPPPEQLQGRELEIQYVSILSVAQKAIATAPTERFIQFLGGIAGARPDALDIPDFDTLIRDYARNIGVSAKSLLKQEDVEQARAARAEQQQMAQVAELGGQAAQAAKVASETEVGGGRSVLNEIIG